MRFQLIHKEELDPPRNKWCHYFTLFTLDRESQFRDSGFLARKFWNDWKRIVDARSGHSRASPALSGLLATVLQRLIDSVRISARPVGQSRGWALAAAAKPLSATTAGFTKLSGSSPRAIATIDSADSSQKLTNILSENPPMWGVSTTFGSLVNGCEAGSGSLETTSRAAAAGP